MRLPLERRITGEARVQHTTHGEETTRQRAWWAVWAVVAAFGTYFSMYGFRKPFTAASYEETELWGIGFKTILVCAQVAGYTISKFMGIKVIAEMPPAKRAVGILALIGVAEGALVLFGVLPRPWNALALFLNGLPLGMVFGLVLGFLEGRRLTEALTAGLCASFILADGVVKSVGAWLLKAGVPEDWMPAAAGAIFAVPLVVGVEMLRRIPAPSAADVSARAAREVMTSADRRAVIVRHGVGLLAITLMFLILTVIRSIRADFAPEIWTGLGAPAAPATFTLSEMVVGLGVLLLCGLTVVIRDNRRAFQTALGVCLFGFLLLAGGLLLRGAELISPFAFMVLTGLGLYLPYVAVHTTVFERLLAMTREKGNLGFLMYVADSIGYLGYVAILIGKTFLPMSGDMFGFFLVACWSAVVVSTVCLGITWVYFARKGRRATGPVVAGAAAG